MNSRNKTERRGMSEREYARHAGLSRGAVQKARASGRLVVHADGSIDAAASDARRAQATDPAKQRGVRQETMRAVPRAAVGAVSDTLREHGMPEPTGGSMGASADAKGVSYLQARTANEVMKAHERRLRLQTLKGEVVDRARAVALVFRLARQERDAWAGWPARIAAVMAAEVGVGTHTMQTVLETHVREHLGELSEIRPELR